MRNCQRYLVERVLDDWKKQVMYEGTLIVEGISPCLKPPLKILRVEVLQIIPGCSGSCGSDVSSLNQLHLILSCTIMDCCGRKETGFAQIVCQENACAHHLSGNVHYNAQIRLDYADFCSGTMFHICASLCIHTMVCCHEMIGEKRESNSICNTLPMYPQSMDRRWNCGRKFFGCFESEKGKKG